MLLCLGERKCSGKWPQGPSVYPVRSPLRYPWTIRLTSPGRVVIVLNPEFWSAGFRRQLFCCRSIKAPGNGYKKQIRFKNRSRVSSNTVHESPSIGRVHSCRKSMAKTSLERADNYDQLRHRYMDRYWCYPGILFRAKTMIEPKKNPKINVAAISQYWPNDSFFSCLTTMSMRSSSVAICSPHFMRKSMASLNIGMRSVLLTNTLPTWRKGDNTQHYVVLSRLNTISVHLWQG